MMVVVQSEPAIEATAGSPTSMATVVGDWSGIDPWSIVGVAIAGVVLLLLGAKILRPAMVLAASTLGAMIGLQLAGATRAGTLPELVQQLHVPPMAWVIGVPLVLGVATLAVARFVLAVLLGLSVGTGVLLIALGLAPRQPVEGPAAFGASIGSAVSLVRIVPQNASEDAPDAGGGGMAELIPDDVTDRVADEVIRNVFGELSTAAADHVSEPPAWSAVIPRSIADWWSEITADVGPQHLELIVALATVVAICTTLLGLILPKRTAILATAVCGGWLLSGAMVTAWVRWMPDSAPPTPFNTLLAWAVLTALGGLYQSRGGRRKPERRADA